MGPDLLKFANIAPILILARHQGPNLRDLFLLYIQHPRAFRGVEPFVEGSAEVIAIEVAAVEIELGERVSPVNNGLDAAGPSHLADLLDRVDLAREIDLVRDKN